MILGRLVHKAGWFAAQAQIKCYCMVYEGTMFG